MRLVTNVVALSSIVVWTLACGGPGAGEGAVADDLRIVPGGEGADDGEATPPGGSGTGGDCTLTQGFWKTHEASWPVDSLVIGGQTYSQAELLDLLWTSVNGDGSLILGHQLIAAMLNVANGATPIAAIAEADAWMAANADADGRLPYGTAPGDEVSSLRDALAAFNQGNTGPGHCDDKPNGGEGGGSSTGSGGSGTGSGGAGSGTGGEPGNVCTECSIDEHCGTNAYCSSGCCYDIPL
jgi:hypothetical protein